MRMVTIERIRIQDGDDHDAHNHNGLDAMILICQHIMTLSSYVEKTLMISISVFAAADGEGGDYKKAITDGCSTVLLKLNGLGVDRGMDGMDGLDMGLARDM